MAEVSAVRNYVSSKTPHTTLKVPKYRGHGFMIYDHVWNHRVTGLRLLSSPYCNPLDYYIKMKSGNQKVSSHFVEKNEYFLSTSEFSDAFFDLILIILFPKFKVFLIEKKSFPKTGDNLNAGADFRPLTQQSSSNSSSHSNRLSPSNAYYLALSLLIVATTCIRYRLMQSTGHHIL